MSKPTHPNQDTLNTGKVRDILGCTCSFNETYDGKSYNLKTNEYEDCSCVEMLPNLLELILEIIGEDENETPFTGIKHPTRIDRNQLRAELRQAFRKAFGGSDG